MEVKKIIFELGLKNIRIWKISYFGGYRFVFIMISFFDGRYYGLFNREFF